METSPRLRAAAFVALTLAATCWGLSTSGWRVVAQAVLIGLVFGVVALVVAAILAKGSDKSSSQEP